MQDRRGCYRSLIGSHSYLLLTSTIVDDLNDVLRSFQLTGRQLTNKAVATDIVNFSPRCPISQSRPHKIFTF